MGRIIEFGGCAGKAVWRVLRPLPGIQAHLRPDGTISP